MSTDVHERDEFLTVEELAKEWRQHPGTIYRKIAAGAIPSVRLGSETSALRIPRSELERQMSVGGSSAETAVGHSSDDDPAERDGTSRARAEAVEPAPLVGSSERRQHE